MNTWFITLEKIFHSINIQPVLLIFKDYCLILTDMPNQNPEQLARDIIDSALEQSGWVIQGENQINLNAAIGIAVREYQTDIGPADYVLFVDKNPIGIIEAKRAKEGVHLTCMKTRVRVMPLPN